MSLRGDAISQAGANKAVRPPTGLGMRRPFLRKETGEIKSYAIDRPFRSDFESIVLYFFLILFEAGRIENEMKKYGKSSKPFFWFKGCSPYRSTKGFRGLHLPITRQKGSLL